MEPAIILLYLDPASGSLAFQILIGGFLAAMAVVRRHWNRAAFWRRLRK